MARLMSGTVSLPDLIVWELFHSSVWPSLHVSVILMAAPEYLPQPNSTQPRVGLALFSYGNHNHNHNRLPLYLSSYTTKLDQIQYATLFQPN